MRGTYSWFAVRRYLRRVLANDTLWAHYTDRGPKYQAKVAALKRKHQGELSWQGRRAGVDEGTHHACLLCEFVRNAPGERAAAAAAAAGDGCSSSSGGGGEQPQRSSSLARNKLKGRTLHARGVGVA